MKDDKVIEGEVKEEVVVEEKKTEVVEVKKSLLDKPKALWQKHGKKLVVGTLLAIGGVALYGLGKQAGINSVDTDDSDNYDSDETSDDYSSENNTTEF